MSKLMIPFLILLLWSCDQKNEDMPSPAGGDELYFPPLNSDSWSTSSPENLNWNIEQLEDLYNFLSTNNTRAFIILKGGKMVVEKYFGNNILNTAPFDQNTNWYWASAGKSMTAFLVGLAQEKGLLDINDKSSDYLGANWTSLPADKQNLITVRNQLTMTTGLDYQVQDLNCTDPDCLQYRADAGTQWFYHNAPYTLLEKVVSNAAGITYNQFTDNELESKIGMNGQWIMSGYNNVYWSTARDAARFGLLVLNEGSWEEVPIMADSDYFNDMVNTSQNLNLSYGYLWWLNGKGSVIFPGLPNSFNLSLAPNAPDDLFAAMGKNGQIIAVVPSENMVVVRMGEAPADALVPVQFHDEMWEKIGEIISPR